MKNIAGLDLGTNSIGWAVIDEAVCKISGLGSRIIPMSQDILGNFNEGNSVSQTAERTGFRGTRRPRERHLLRRERLHRVLHILEHIIPQSRYFDDSFSNKVICEASVNRLKDNQLGFEFIKGRPGEKVSLGLGQIVEIFSEEDYQVFVREYYANNRSKRTKLLLEDIPESFTEKTIKESVTDSGIQKILVNYLASKDNKPERAFSPEGIEEMNQNMTAFNNGKSHQPIRKVRVYETTGNKFQVGYAGNKKVKYVEAAKGTNLFFAIYADDKGVRSYETIPLNIVVERLKQGLNAVSERNEKGHELLFHLSPNDLVYVPTEEETANNITEESINLSRIYKIVSFTGNILYAIPYFVAKPIVDKIEFSQLNKVRNDINDNFPIKQVCIKLNIDRLGNIKLLLP
jgi:hypothetical protein